MSIELKSLSLLRGVFGIDGMPCISVELPILWRAFAASPATYYRNFLKHRRFELVPPRPLVLQKWCPPTPDIYKANFDAAVFRSSNLVGLGVIVRDNCGEPTGALSMPINLGQSMAEMEALACQRAVQFAIKIGFT